MSKKNFIYRPLDKRTVQSILRQIRNAKAWKMTIERDEGGWYSMGSSVPSWGSLT
jgi:hypothetical protein